MAINEVTSIDVKTLPPFKRLIMTLGELPTSYLESMTYAEMLMWFCNFLQEKVLPTINNNADALQDVITYLESLDLQDEVDHKLDEMAESGQLQEIITDYLNSKAIFAFDTVASMKEATNFINGSYAKTLGYYEANDGGSALYKIRTITNEDTVDEMFIIALSDESLIAELVQPEMLNIKCLGAKGDNETVDTLCFKKAIEKNQNIFIPNGQFIIDDTLNITDIITIDGNGYDSEIKYTGNGFLFNISTNLAHKPLIKNVKLTGTNSNSCIKVARDGFGASFLIENCTITSFNDKVFELTSVFDPIIRNVRIISAGKILFNTYDGAYGENSFSNNILFEHVYYTGDPNPAPLLFDLNNVRYLNFIGCQFEKVTKLIDAKNNTKFVILDHSWVENVTDFYSVDSSSESIKAKNTNVVLTTNYNANHGNIDYLDGNDKKVINIKNTSNDTYKTLHDTDNMRITNLVVYNSNNSSYPYQQLFDIGTNNTLLNMPINITKHDGSNVSSLSYQVKQITRYSNTPVMFKFFIDVTYSDYSERMYEFNYFQKTNSSYKLLSINKVYETTWQNSGTTQYSETITESSGTVTITSTGTMATCTMRIKHEFIK